MHSHSPLTVACVFVKGEYPYTADYVSRLRAMCECWLDRTFRFVCLTDQPELVQDAEAVPVQKLAGFAPWTKLELFSPERQWHGRVLYLDLDSLIVAPLSAIVDVPAAFAITEDLTNARNKTRDSFGRQIVRRFNSSVMVWDGGTHTELFTKWTPAVSDRLSGDQDWIGEQLPGAVTLPRSWFPRLSELQGAPPKAPAKVVLAKVPKNDRAVKLWPWVAEAWRAA
jgi:hypothetical protein